MNLVAAIAAFLFFGWAAPDVARAMIPREKLVSIIAARMEGPTPIEQRVRERVNGGALAASAAVGPVVAGKSLLVKSFVASSAYAAAYELGGIPSGDVSAERYGQTVAIGTTAGVVIGGTTRLVGAIVSEVKRMPLQATLRDCRVEPWHSTSLSPAAKSMPDPYVGIRQASQYLRERGVSRADRVRYLQSFEPQNMVVRQAGQSEFGLRYFSDPSRAGGQYLFETFPTSRASLAIKPEWSSMSGFRQFQIRPGATVLEGRAAAQWPYLPGGQMQKFILDWRSDLIP